MVRTLKFSVYHSLLRISVLVLAFVLVFDSGLLFQSTEGLSNGAQNFVAAAVGVKAGVAPNDVNILTTRITELEEEVKAKDRQIAVNLNNSESAGFDTSTFILSSILFILLVLIIINYILDYIRTRPGIRIIRGGQTSQPY